jgi:hypothetical protein
LTELQEAIDGYKAKADSYLAKLEEAEIARVKSARAESLGWFETCVALGRSLTLFNQLGVPLQTHRRHKMKLSQKPKDSRNA